MPTLTAFILAGFVGYAGSWILGYHEGNFALLMLLATVVSGVYWLLEKWIFLPRRIAAANALVQQETQRREQLQAQGIAQAELDLASARQEVLRQPW